MAIECIGFKSVEKGNMLGVANLFLTNVGMEIYGCTLHQKDGRRWVNLPVKEFKDKETGETKYFQFIKFPDSRFHNAFVKGAKEAIDEWCNKNAEKVNGESI